MDSARFSLAHPDDRQLLDRLMTAVVAQEAPPISVARSPMAVLTFEADTADVMLRSRVVQALEVAVGPDWQHVAMSVD